ncbi:methyltransferase [Thermosipho melanesiensis]|uniref:Methyltransferase n=2 Tax=Thermosipho melanesiensis TaxID=46541 RepID=A6LN98_THEM4|nr:class I SAM-dependent methyltransferase [Thermosipho melanesiensis]ABR31399.1 hypothetical protein Tmel_1554 [Thermosipho melanesiensis BI429]APT74458.1 methyltransferase [Thermosipho melanesiensis]OOC36418.1 methyltransferase [Thermosipho melanesiensis]OOC37236.1 methyltransferase [Thermosipho melanesiensis]OOC37988.1 methyltransferase [Thermosipho melanesiensis]
MRFVVTTSYNPNRELVEKAKKLAKEYGVKYVNRNHLTKYIKRSLIDFYYVIDKKGMLSIKWEDGEFFFHQGIAKIRMENIKHGQKDYLIEAISPKESDIVYDATCGLASEALLIANYAKKVVATEGSKHIYRVVKWGLLYYISGENWVNNAKKKIELVNENYKSYIRRVEDNAFDIVYCDPMFENPIYESNSLNPLRSFAIYESLNTEDLEEMLRISRKKVVIKTLKKDSLYDKIKEYFDKEYLVRKNGVVYGVINKLEV